MIALLLKPRESDVQYRDAVKITERRRLRISYAIGLARSASPTRRRYWNVSVAVLGMQGGTV
jgi:hypothetical protein